ncbi:MAG: OmpA family protein [Alphaproteobacteria bacterium]|nr:OmpA family protein [Alphaproteobacteria bacterium]
MSRKIELFLTGSLLMVLGACTTALPPEKTEALGMPFNEQLKTRYLELAASRRSSLDFDYFHFREKAEASLLGDVVAPDSVADHDICLGWQPDALAARERLLGLLEDDARIKAPGTAADAQVDFDCWLDELEAQSQQGCSNVAQNTKPPAASRCGDRLMTNLDALANEGAPFSVFFASGRTRVDDDGQEVVARVKRSADLVQPSRIVVVGYADRRGIAADNKRLAEERAREVAKALIAEGVPAAAVSVEAWGETISAESLDENRRVEITFEN